MPDSTVIVTGASRGIGLAVAAELASRGHRIVGIARSEERLVEALAGLAGEGHHPLAMDVGEASAWPAAIEAAAGRPLGGLVCAAATLGPIGHPAEVDPAEVEKCVRTNLLGTFYAIHHCLPVLLTDEAPAIVTFSGGGGSGPLPRYDAYAASKAAVVRLTENVAVAEPRVRCNAVAPGFVATEIHQGTLSAGPERAGAIYHEDTVRNLDSGGVPAGRAAALVATLLGPDAAGITGKLISAPWDRWDEPSFRARLAREPDLCALRRIDDFRFTAIEPERR